MRQEYSEVRRKRRGGPAVKKYTPSQGGRGGGRGRQLIDRVHAVCLRLAPLGWQDLLLHHGLNITAGNLGEELGRPLDAIDRLMPGFEDFAWEGSRGIEPGKPSLSLLFHALASPRVDGSGRFPLAGFPFSTEIEIVENYVYGARPPSIEELRVAVENAPLAIVAFATEYRPACDTIHRKHADACFARTGIARVGSEPARYLPRERGYMPFVDNDPHRVRVLPCRYAPYIAALLPGAKRGHGPLRFIEGGSGAAEPIARTKDAGLEELAPALRNPRRVSDSSRNFWIPVHKLFDGPECIRGHDLTVRLSANHLNEKIRRAHLFFGANGHDAGWTEPDISESPFIFREGIAEFSSEADDGSWLLAPVPHSPVIKPAVYKKKPLTYLVPESTDAARWRPYQSSLNLAIKPSGARAAPEYLHARHKITKSGKLINLNKRANVIDIVRKGGYRALHYQDFTGDGWIDVECSALALEIPRRLPAYSIVATPDFFPTIKQSSLMDWTDQSVPSGLLGILWPENPGRPQALSDQRYAANLELPGAGFDPADDTMTAVVGQLGSGAGRLTRLERRKDTRATTLPDAAAGVFAPGWDVAFDRTSEADPDDTGEVTSGITFLTTYGLGSPFMEDSKLCAALSAFWPAVAPDTARTYAPIPKYSSATPLTDDVIGLEKGPAWDGIVGPRVNSKSRTIEYPALAYGDYVEAALKHRFNIDKIARTSVDDYVARTLAMARVYSALDARNQLDKTKWALISFRKLDPGDADYRQACRRTKRTLHVQFAYRFEMIEHKDQRAGTGKRFDKVYVSYDRIELLYADPSLVLHRQDNGTWTVHELRR
jgi:hypothetical protein